MWQYAFCGIVAITHNYATWLLNISYTTDSSGLGIMYVKTGRVLQQNMPFNPYSAMWRIWWAPNNVSRWQMGFNSAFKELINCSSDPDSFGRSPTCTINKNVLVVTGRLSKDDMLCTIPCWRYGSYWNNL
jgi:hypothetical protein